MKRLRVLVVEDSLTIRRRFCEILAGDPELDVIAEAADGKQAIELCGTLRPDVVTLDMVLPVMSGLTAAEYIMAYFPTSILIVSASTNRGELFKTYDALRAGALDVLEKPRVDEIDEAWQRRFIASVKLVAKIKVITHPRARLAGTTLPLEGPAPSKSAAHACRVIACGASTGGPAAIVEVLRGLPAGFDALLLIVLHIDDPFGAAFAEWLDTQTPHRVTLARDRQALHDVRGRVLLAPPGVHLVVEGGQLILQNGAPRHSCRPSIDVLFESLAREHGPEVMACLLTGMGRDGAAGLLAIRQRGGFTIAQDEATSIVYGMPCEAVRLKAAELVLPLQQIGPELARRLAMGGRPFGRHLR